VEGDAKMTQQSNWELCSKCEGLFFAGDDAGVCPAGGAHSKVGSSGYVCSDVGSGQADWKHCSKCQGLFYSKISLGVCPTHSDTGSSNYSLSVTGAGQTGWQSCSKCLGLFYSVNSLGVCAAGGSHDGVGSTMFVLPQTQTANAQAGWKHCSKCQGLFFATNNPGGCPAGGPHDGSNSGPYFLSLPGVGANPQWKLCNQCQGLFFAGTVNFQGVCPAPGGHTDTGSDNYILPQSTVSGNLTQQSGWVWCNRCQGLFYGGDRSVQLFNNFGVCPSRATQADHVPDSAYQHDGTTSGQYFILTGFATPPNGLGGFSQYVLSNPASSATVFVPLLNLVVEIEITGPLVVSLISGLNPGTTIAQPIGFQINGFSQKGDKIISWQQCGVQMIQGTNQLKSFAENWPPNGPNVFNISSVNSISLPNDLTIPAGWTIRVAFQQQTDGTITGFNCSVTDREGAPVGNNLDISLIGQPLAAGGTIGQNDLAQIVAFQVVLVGWANSAHATLTSGTGKITCSSSTLMAPSIPWPAESDGANGTAEEANSTYGLMLAQPSFTIAQTFGVN
jgi:hypothetical protein